MLLYLEVTTPSDHSQRANKDDSHDEDQDNSGDTSIATRHTKHPGVGGEDPLDIGPLGTLRVRQTGLAVSDAGVDGETSGDHEGVPLTELS